MSLYPFGNAVQLDILKKLYLSKIVSKELNIYETIINS